MNVEKRIAVYVDYENVAIGLRGKNRPNFDIHVALERLLEKGRILVKNAYCDWQSYRDARRPMHEAGFTLVEIPHLRYSGKNSADIRMVVDALDLCYTRDHIDTFALVTGDSDFTPLVSKLRENGKEVIGIGVEDSSSNLLIEACDEFWYYEELAKQPVPTRRERAPADTGEEPSKKGDDTKKKTESKALMLTRVAETARSLIDDRGEAVWASHVKQVLKRKQPNFSESAYGFRSFGQLIENARDRGLIEIERDKASGGYRVLSVKSDT